MCYKCTSLSLQKNICKFNKIDFSSQFQHHFTSTFCAGFLFQKNYKKSCSVNTFFTKKLLVKCLWNWHQILLNRPIFMTNFIWIGAESNDDWEIIVPRIFPFNLFPTYFFANIFQDENQRKKWERGERLRRVCERDRKREREIGCVCM